MDENTMEAGRDTDLYLALRHAILRGDYAFGSRLKIDEIARRFGSQSVMVSIDFRKNLFGTVNVYTDNGRTNTHKDPVKFAKQMEDAGAGEILLNSIDRDGTFEGYDLDMIKKVSDSVNIPVIAMGGAASLQDFRLAVEHGASAVSAGSMFVFQRPHRAVLISYPTQKELENQLYTALT